MELFFRSLDGNIFGLNVQANSTVLGVKEQIQDREMIPIEHQRLLYNNIELNNNAILEDYAIPNLANLDLNIELLGGFNSFTGFSEKLQELALMNRVDKKVCRKCYSLSSMKAKNCKNKKCGHNSDLRNKKAVKHTKRFRDWNEYHTAKLNFPNLNILSK